MVAAFAQESSNVDLAPAKRRLTGPMATAHRHPEGQDQDGDHDGPGWKRNGLQGHQTSRGSTSTARVTCETISGFDFQSQQSQHQYARHGRPIAHLAGRPGAARPGNPVDDTNLQITLVRPVFPRVESLEP
jgi:hypothetical protein